jgi:AraC family transcriptional regulator
MLFSKTPTLKLRAPHGIRNFSYQSRMWNGVAVYHVTQYLDPGQCWQNLCTEQANVGVVLEQVGGYCEPRIRLNNPTPRSRYDAGHVMYIPPHVDVWGYGADSTSFVRDIRMQFDCRVIERLLAEEFDRKRWSEPLLLLYDDRLTQCADLLAKEIAEQDDDLPLFGESLVTALFAALFTAPRSRFKAYQSGLTRSQLSRSLDYIEANLLNNVRLHDLASVAGLSPSHFGRAFKTSTGLTPYRWVIEQRIYRAKRLMMNGGKSISIAAHLAGFANQSHFTKVFRRVTGTTPGLWLRDAG